MASEENNCDAGHPGNEENIRQIYSQDSFSDQSAHNELETSYDASHLLDGSTRIGLENLRPTPEVPETSRVLQSTTHANISGWRATSSADATDVQDSTISAADSDDSTDEESRCAVCFLQMVLPVCLPCGHIFCYLCVKGVALTSSPRCALCRQAIPADFLLRPTLVQVPEVKHSTKHLPDTQSSQLINGTSSVRNITYCVIDASETGHSSVSGNNVCSCNSNTITGDNVCNRTTDGDISANVDECTSMRVCDSFPKSKGATALVAAESAKGGVPVVDSDSLDYQWFYEGRNGWWKYDQRTTVEIEAFYCKNAQTCQLMVAGLVFVIDFVRMLQYRIKDPTKRRKIKRDVSSIPIKGIAGISLNRLDGVDEEEGLDNSHGTTPVVAGMSVGSSSGAVSRYITRERNADAVGQPQFDHSGGGSGGMNLGALVQNESSELVHDFSVRRRTSMLSDMLTQYRNLAFAGHNQQQNNSLYDESDSSHSNHRLHNSIDVSVKSHICNSNKEIIPISFGTTCRVHSFYGQNVFHSDGTECPKFSLEAAAHNLVNCQCQNRIVTAEMGSCSRCELHCCQAAHSCHCSSCLSHSHCFCCHQPRSGTIVNADAGSIHSANICDVCTNGSVEEAAASCWCSNESIINNVHHARCSSIAAADPAMQTCTCPLKINIVQSVPSSSIICNKARQCPISSQKSNMQAHLGLDCELLDTGVSDYYHFDSDSSGEFEIEQPSRVMFLGGSCNCARVLSQSKDNSLSSPVITGDNIEESNSSTVVTEDSFINKDDK